MIKEFKEFINRGSVVDLAVGVMIGSAFSEIISSVVDDLIMPIIGGIFGGFNFSTLNFTIGNSIIKYGLLIQNIVNFFLIAAFLFIIIRFINKFNKKEDSKNKQKATPPAPSEDVVLLKEIRDLLKNKK